MNQKMLKPHRTAPASMTEEMLQRVREGEGHLPEQVTPQISVELSQDAYTVTLDSDFLSSPFRVTLESPQAQGHLNVIPASSRSSQTHHRGHVKVRSGASSYYQPWLYPKLRVSSESPGVIPAPHPVSLRLLIQLLGQPKLGPLAYLHRAHHQTLMLPGWGRDRRVARVGQSPSRLLCQAAHPDSTVQV